MVDSDNLTMGTWNVSLSGGLLDSLPRVACWILDYLTGVDIKCLAGESGGN